jgi:hypothetical protein
LDAITGSLKLSSSENPPNAGEVAQDNALDVLLVERALELIVGARHNDLAPLTPPCEFTKAAVASVPTKLPVNRPADRATRYRYRSSPTESVTPVWLSKADVGIGGVEAPLAVLVVELVEEQAAGSPATSKRQMATAETEDHRIRTIT